MKKCKIKNPVYMLRTCNADMTSPSPEANEFRWPKSGWVEALDWDPTPECGHGLHGLLHGQGDGRFLSKSGDAQWLVVAVDERTVINLQGKCKVPAGEVVFCGDRTSALEFLKPLVSQPELIVYGHATAGDSGQATAGYSGHATVGYYGQATAGYYGHATAGYSGQAAAGYSGQATAGDSGQATAGDSGQATAGDYGQAAAGDSGHATAGYSGHATAGDYGIIQIAYFDGNRRRIVTGYIGEDGLKAGVAYRLNDQHQFEEVTP